MITGRQITKLLSEFHKKGDLTMSAMKSDMCRKTAAKYLQMEDPHNPPRSPHAWLTHPDIFSSVWPEAEVMLHVNPGLEAKSLFEHIMQLHPGVFAEKHLRTFQRRVSQWRAVHGPSVEVYFAQNHPPGEVMQTDWTHASELGVTIAGKAYPHMLCHSVLVYSNWQWATRCTSESLLSLRAGLQAALSRLGRVPRILQIDNSSTATHRLSNDSSERGFTNDFLALVEHFAIQPRTINIGAPNENGDVESLNGHLKRRLKQALLLRGSSDFAEMAAYDAFLSEVLNKANAGRAEKVTQELNVMRGLPCTILPDYQEYEVRVGWQSTIRIKNVAYSVPSRLIKKKVRVRLGETWLEVYFGKELVCKMERSIGPAGGAIIDFRHIIGDLVRKPGAFANWRHRESLFPGVVFRRAYDGFVAALGEKLGEKEYLHLLKLTADTSMAEVELVLVALGAGTEVRLETVRRAMPSYCVATMDLDQPKASLEEYDALLGLSHEEEEEVLHVG